MDIDDAINLAIDNVKKDGLTDVDVFSLPFEIEMIKDEVRNRIFQATKESQKNNSINSLRVSPISHILFPKKELFDFRKCAHIQPLDEIKYLSLVLQLADKIEAARLEKGKKCVFSYRFNPLKGSLFDPDFNYTSFRDHVLKKSRDSHVTVMVSCDISNFYDRLNLHRLESILGSLPETNHKVVKQINELLLFWSNRDSYGLPVGSNASRILAEASLIEVDNYLISKKIIFCRFVDDYRLFANDAATAHHWLSLLVDRLSKEGFFINTSKTHIKDVSESIHETDLTSTNLKKSLLIYAKNEEKKSIEEVISQQKIVDNGSVLINEAEVDVAQEKKNLSKIIRGYSGLIPTKFRKLTENEKRKLRFFNIEKELAEIKSSITIEAKKFIQLVKAGIAKRQYSTLKELVEILNKFPQFLPYTLDAIKKNENEISDEDIYEISNKLKKWLSEWDSSEFILIYIVRFFGNGKFTNKELLFEYFRALKRNQGSYIGRAVLEQLEPLVNRGEVLEIRDYYARADMCPLCQDRCRVT